MDFLDERQPEGDGRDDEWEEGGLLDLFSHDLINNHQAALGFLELLSNSEALGEGERELLDRTVFTMEETARLLLQVRGALARRERGSLPAHRMDLARALEQAKRVAEAGFVHGRLTIRLDEVSQGTEVLADELLPDLFTQLFLLLGDSAPQGRTCALVVRSEPDEGGTRLDVSSEGFALDPMVLEALTGGGEGPGWVRKASKVSMVRQLLDGYDATVRLRPAPPGRVGAELSITIDGGGH